MARYGRLKGIAEQSCTSTYLQLMSVPATAFNHSLSEAVAGALIVRLQTFRRYWTYWIDAS